jgi:hypothetical protein
MNTHPSNSSSSSIHSSENTAPGSAVSHPSGKARLIVLAVSIVLFALACASPTLIFLRNGTSDETWAGYMVLLLGWLGPFIGQFAWYANPVLFVGMITFLVRQWVATIVLIALSLLMAANTFLLFFQGVPADEAGVNMLTLQNLHIGFYLWIASILTIGIGAILLWRAESK